MGEESYIFLARSHVTSKCCGCFCKNTADMEGGERGRRGGVKDSCSIFLSLCCLFLSLHIAVRSCLMIVFSFFFLHIIRSFFFFLLFRPWWWYIGVVRRFVPDIVRCDVRSP